MKVAAGITRTHNPFDEDYWASCLRENLTSSSYGEGLETGRECTQEPRQSFTRQAAFKELKRDIGSAETQTRHPDAVTNHLHFCMMATSAAWIYASRMEKTPSRRHIVEGRNHFAFSDVRKSVAQAAADPNFGILFPVPRKSVLNSLVEVLLRMAA